MFHLNVPNQKRFLYCLWSSDGHLAWLLLAIQLEVLTKHFRQHQILSSHFDCIYGAIGQFPKETFQWKLLQLMLFSRPRTGDQRRWRKGWIRHSRSVWQSRAALFMERERWVWARISSTAWCLPVLHRQQPIQIQCETDLTLLFLLPTWRVGQIGQWS